jgi:hypothetical protein
LAASHCGLQNLSFVAQLQTGFAHFFASVILLPSCKYDADFRHAALDGPILLFAAEFRVRDDVQGNASRFGSVNHQHRPFVCIE